MKNFDEKKVAWASFGRMGRGSRAKGRRWNEGESGVKSDFPLPPFYFFLQRAFTQAS